MGLHLQALSVGDPARRRWTCAAVVSVVAALCAGAPGQAAARTSMSWETAYAGTYTFSGDMKTSEPDGSTVIRHEHAHTATFNWVIDKIDTLTDLGHHRFKERLSIIDVSNGTTHLRDSETLPNEAPFTSTSVDCTVVSTRHQFTRTRTAIAGVLPGKEPAKATVSWSVPVVADENGTYIFDGTPFDESRSAVDGDAPGVTQHCIDNSVDQRYTSSDGASLLDTNVYTTTGTHAGTYAFFKYDKNAALGWQNHAYPSCGGQYLTPTPQFFDLWSGTETTDPFVAYTRDFTFSGGISGNQSNPSYVDAGATQASCSYIVQMASHLLFAQTRCNSQRSASGSSVPVPNSLKPQGAVSGRPSRTRQTACPKVGTLLVHEGIAVMTGNATGLATGEGVDILFPGMPEGGAHAVPEEAIDLTVDAQVVPKHAADTPAAHAAGATALYRGSAKATPGQPAVVSLRPTAAGIRLLRAKHGALKVTARAVVKPAKGHGSTLSGHGAFTIPASG